MNDESTGSPEERSDEEISSQPSEKPTIRKWVSVNIKLVDGHYLATFNHDAPRIFHNMQQLLMAIEVESSKLGPWAPQT